MITRREFLKVGAAGATLLLVAYRAGERHVVEAAIAGGTLAPADIPKYVTPLLIPPVMPRAGVVNRPGGGASADYYEISLKQFRQKILPDTVYATQPVPADRAGTLVWGYGALKAQKGQGLLLHNAPSLTIEAVANRPVRIKWVNELVDAAGNYLPHLLPVDQTLHWANPPGGAQRDMRPMFDATPGRYTGPVPMITHVHGAVGVGDESDGYAEAWYLPAATNIPTEYATEGSWYDFFRSKAAANFGATWEPGAAVFQYPNLNRASTLWYHDHTLGMTRLNVYAGPAGFYIVRGGPAGDTAVIDTRFGTPAVLPGPAPQENDKFPSNKTYYEIPIAIQDRSFNMDGSLFYPDTRAFFDEVHGPFIPEGDFSPIWNPEFFGNMMMINGNTWPFQTVEQRRYRLRFLNGCQSRFLMLDFGNIPGVEVWQIGNEGGFLAAALNVTADHHNRLLMGPAERADVIVDFTQVPPGNYELANLGPDEPFGGGIPGVDFAAADADSTGKIMQFRVVPALAVDPSTPPLFLQLPAITPLPPETLTRKLALIEKMNMELDAPIEALLGRVDDEGNVLEDLWMEPVTENPAPGSTEVWEFYNTTGDAHPMHVHEVVFEVVSRQEITLDAASGRVQVAPGAPLLPPEPWETGFKDTVIAYPAQVTRVRAQFSTAGQFVWHCHIVEHEDNEMMRPFRIGPPQVGQPGM